MRNLIHPFLPIFDENSHILILGSFPSVRSRELGFYYAHPQNRFWRVLGAVFEQDIGENAEAKVEFLRTHHIALYDAARACEITASSDSSMKNIAPSDLGEILRAAKIRAVFANGAKSYEICAKFHRETLRAHVSQGVIKLPSTSAANAKFSLQNLIQNWNEIKKFL